MKLKGSFICAVVRPVADKAASPMPTPFACPVVSVFQKLSTIWLELFRPTSPPTKRSNTRTGPVA
jgi:hypothetical protein